MKEQNNKKESILVVELYDRVVLHTAKLLSVWKTVYHKIPKMVEKRYKLISVTV